MRTTYLADAWQSELLRKNLVCFIFVISKMLLLVLNLRFVIFCQFEIYRLNFFHELLRKYLPSSVRLLI